MGLTTVVEQKGKLERVKVPKDAVEVLRIWMYPSSGPGGQGAFATLTIAPGEELLTERERGRLTMLVRSLADLFCGAAFRALDKWEGGGKSREPSDRRR